MAKRKTYQIIFEGGASTFVKAHGFRVDGDDVTLLDENDQPLDKHYLRSGAVQAVISADDDPAGGGGFTPSLSQ
jgi:hypothetical protein